MKKSILWYILIIVISGCASQEPVIRLSPSTVDNKDYWSLGQHFVYASDNNILYECSFNRIYNNKLIFDVKITNQSDTSVLVDPSLFYQEIYKNESDKIAQNNAYDPELILVGLQLDQNMQNARAKNAAVFFIGAALLTTGALIAIESSHKNEIEKEVECNEIEATNAIAQTASIATMASSDIKAEDSKIQQGSLSDAFLRKTTLAKGFFIDGEVHFPYYDNAMWYHLFFTSGNSQVDFHFRQSKIYSIPGYNCSDNRQE
jgi:hypothetical protein